MTVASSTMNEFGEMTALAARAVILIPTFNSAAFVSQTLDSLGSKTAKLAEQGNASAKTIIDDLKRQGITFKTNP